MYSYLEYIVQTLIPYTLITQYAQNIYILYIDLLIIDFLVCQIGWTELIGRNMHVKFTLLHTAHWTFWTLSTEHPEHLTLNILNTKH